MLKKDFRMQRMIYSLILITDKTLKSADNVRHERCLPEGMLQRYMYVRTYQYTVSGALRRLTRLYYTTQNHLSEQHRKKKSVKKSVVFVAVWLALHNLSSPPGFADAKIWRRKILNESSSSLI